MSWTKADEYCTFGGMVLAQAISPEQNVALVDLAQSQSPVDDLGLSHPYLSRNWVSLEFCFIEILYFFICSFIFHLLNKLFIHFS